MNAFSEGTMFRIRELLRHLWVRVVLFSVAGVVVATLSAGIGPYLPYKPSIDLASGAVDDLLHILASSMLAVTTFSISIMVAAYGRATSNGTPRATVLLAADPVAQLALSVFIGSFAFSIVGIIGLSAGVYEGSARVILFLATLAVIVLIAWAMIRWIDHLNDFGRVSDIISRLEVVATDAALKAGARPRLGGMPGPAPGIGPDSATIDASESGYLRYVDVEALDKNAADVGVTVQLDRMVGDFVVKTTPLARVSRPLSSDEVCKFRNCFTVGRQRSFDQDMEYGLVVLSEVASRALSPAVNDPGTAIEVLRAGTRVLLAFHEARNSTEAAECRHLHAPDTDIASAYRRFFAPIARDGAALLEVQMAVQTSLAELATLTGATAARIEARDALERALTTLERERERRLLKEASEV